MSKKNLDFDALERVCGKDLPTDIHGLAQMVGRVYVVLSRQLNGLETKVDGLETKVDGLETKVDGLEKRLTNIEADVRTIKTILDIDQQMENLQTVFGSRGGRHRARA